MEISKRIGNYLNGCLGSAVGEDEDIFRGGLVDSLFAMQLVLFIERDFQIKVEDEDLDLDNFCSIDAMTAFVSRKLGRNEIDGLSA